MRLVEALGMPNLPIRKCSQIGEKAWLMDSKVGLKKYISVGGKWRFVPVLWKNGELCPDTILLDSKPLQHRGSGTFYLDWRENGKRIQLPCGKELGRRLMHGAPRL